MAAPPELVFALARDLSRWPDLLPHYRAATVERSEGDAAIVRFIAVRPGIVALPVLWRSRTWAEPESLRLHFVHLGGATRGMDVTWRIEATGRGCRVTIAHSFPAPRPWAAFIDRVFTRPIAGRTLATFRAIAEAANRANQLAGPPPADTSP